MAMLKLTVAVGGLALTIPAQSIRTIEQLAPGRFSDAPEAGCAVRYLVGNQLRARILAESRDELRVMLQADRAARQDFRSVEMQGELGFDFLLSDLAGIEDLDPEAPASKGCNALLDLSIEGVPVIDLYASADTAELRAAAWPDATSDELTTHATRKTARAAPGSRKAR